MSIPTNVYGEQAEGANRYRTPQIVRDLKKGRAEGCGICSQATTAGLTISEWPPLVELMDAASTGRAKCSTASPIPEIWKCSPLRFAGAEEAMAGAAAEWRNPLGFLDDRAEAASSDATNIRCTIRRDGDHYVINGRKWFTSGAMNEDCKGAHRRGQDPDNPDKRKQQSGDPCRADTPGVKIRVTCASMANTTMRRSAIPKSSTITRRRKTCCSAKPRGFEIARGVSVQVASIIA